MTCHLGGWDTHWDHQKRMEEYLPRVDQIVRPRLTIFPNGVCSTR
ncbi:MAG: hypothetical protein R3C12_20510 [Planctomycetaceae bacterium]